MPIRQLGESCAAFLSRDRKEKSASVETACVLTNPYADLLPGAVRKHVRETAGRAKIADVAQLNDRLRKECPDQAGWVDIDDERGVRRYFEIIASKSIVNTVQFLWLLHHLLLNHPEAELPASAMRGVRDLLVKFEVFGRIFTLYTDEFRKSSDTYDALLPYGLLSMVLLKVYDRLDRPEFFNAGLKVNDTLVAVVSYLSEPLEVFVALASLCYGKSNVGKLYARRGFRLPSGQ